MGFKRPSAKIVGWKDLGIDEQLAKIHTDFKGRVKGKLSLKVQRQIWGRTHPIAVQIFKRVLSRAGFGPDILRQFSRIAALGVENRELWGHFLTIHLVSETNEQRLAQAEFISESGRRIKAEMFERYPVETRSKAIHVALHDVIHNLVIDLENAKHYTIPPYDEERLERIRQLLVRKK